MLFIPLFQRIRDRQKNGRFPESLIVCSRLYSAAFLTSQTASKTGQFGFHRSNNASNSFLLSVSVKWK